MHLYLHHIGDFIRATARLTDAQTMAYLRLIWRYYDKQEPFVDDVETLAFQIGSDQETVRLILKSYFKLDDQGLWRHSRCDKEISTYEENQKKRSKAGKASAERKKNASPSTVRQKRNNRSTPVEQVSDSSSTLEQLTINHKPITNNQEKDIPPIPPKGGACRFEEFWELYPKSPRKVAKDACLKAWKRYNLDAIGGDILGHLQVIKGSTPWTTGFAPAPLTYINQKRWLDDLPEAEEINWEADGWK
jgi:uncharacterized protein YdaU (DUF1376 family)